MGMKNQADWRGKADMHVSTFIEEEMEARNWTRDHMALAMAAAVAGDPGRMRLELDLLIAVGPTDDRLRIGRTAEAVDAAFGLSPGFSQRLEDGWLAARGVNTRPTPSGCGPIGETK